MTVRTLAQVFVKTLFLAIPIAALSGQYTGNAPYFAEKGGLMINEISNGVSGAQEYVELVVTGNPSSPALPVDLSGWILDDNNYAGSGQGNAQGHLVFGSCYQAVPPGSILVVYNASERNPALPPDDPFDTAPADGVYIIPHTHDCMDACNSNPSTSDPDYCPCSNPSANVQGWQVGLRNAGDMVQVRDRCETLVHAIYWGGIQVESEVSDGPVEIAINGDQGGRVIQFIPGANENWADENNFVDIPSLANESPGLPNNPGNAAFINSIKQMATSSGRISDCMDTDAGDLTPPADAAGSNPPLQLCQGEDFSAFGTDYSRPDEFQPNAPGFDFEYAYILTQNNPPDYSLVDFNIHGDFDWAALDPGAYLVWGFSYIQTNGSFGVEAFLQTVQTITEIREYAACGFDADLDNLTTDGVPMEVQVLSGSGTVHAAVLNACDNGAGLGTFNLSALETEITDGPVNGITWFLDAAAVNPVPNPVQFISGNTVVYAQPGPGACSSGPVPIQLSVLDPIQPVLTAVQGINCPGDSTGSISLGIQGGKAPFQISWSNSNFNQENIYNLPAGTYSVTVTDEVGCRGENSIDLVDPAPISVICGQVSPVTTIGGSDGVASFEITGGLAPYGIKVEGPTDLQLNIVEIPHLESGLPAGTYTITVMDARGCSAACSFEIGYPDCPFLLEMKKYDISCYGMNDGEVSLKLYGGTEPYNTLWNTGANTLGLREVGPGTYSVTIVDAIGCKVSGSIDVMEPGPIEAAIEWEDPSCSGFTDGKISVLDVQGGTAPYFLSLADRQPDSLAGLPLEWSGLSSGNYSVVVQDLRFCETTYNLELTDPSPLELELGEDLNIVRGDTIALVPETNFQPATFAWSPGGFFPMGSWLVQFSPRVTATFTLEASDSRGCTVSDQVTVNVAGKPLPVFIPSVFSPNLDGMNDRFTVYGNEAVREIQSMQVFDRWGGQVFTASNIGVNDERRGWDGKSRGKPLPEGIYVFWLEVVYQDGKTEIFKGDVMLVR